MESSLVASLEFPHEARSLRKWNPSRLSAVAMPLWDHKSIKKAEQSDHVDCSFFVNFALTSLNVSNLLNLTILGSKMNVFGSTSGHCSVDNHVLIVTRGVIEANIPPLTLSLRDHRITDVGLEYICRAIIGQKTLFHLDLDGNDIVGRNISLLGLSDHDCSLVSVNLSCNPLIKAAGMTIAYDMRTNKSLLRLRLNNSGLSLSVIIALATTELVRMVARP